VLPRFWKGDLCDVRRLSSSSLAAEKPPWLVVGISAEVVPWAEEED